MSPPNLSTGYCAMQNVGIWAISALQENAPDFEYGIFKLPIPEGGTYTTDLGGWAFVANSQGQNPEAAAQFCVWALGSMSEDSIQRGVDWCTEAKSDMAPRQVGARTRRAGRVRRRSAGAVRARRSCPAAGPSRA